MTRSDPYLTVEMPTMDSLRNLIKERLTAAAEEILGVFEQTLSVYEEEIDRQRRLLDIVLKPEIKLHRTVLPQQHVHEEQLCDQERNSSLDEEEPVPPQMKEEREELCISEEGEQLVLKQEGDFLKTTPTYERSDHSKDCTVSLDPDQNQTAAENEPPDSVSCKTTISEAEREKPGGPESNSDRQPPFHTSHVADNKDHKGGNCGNAIKQRTTHRGTSTSTRKTKPNLKKQQKYQGHKKHSWGNTVSPTYSQPKSSDRSFKCKICSKGFDLCTQLEVHMRIHTAKKSFSCTVCGRKFSFKRYLKQHMITHTDERPYSCSRCWKNFRRFEHLQVHMRSHTGERPYSCVYCEKAFSTNSGLTKHVQLHSSLCSH